MTNRDGSAYVPSAQRKERESAQRRAARRSALIAAVSTIAVGLVVYLSITSAPGWERVQTSFFSFEYAVEAVPMILKGLWLNLRVLVVCSIIIMSVGISTTHKVLLSREPDAHIGQIGCSLNVLQS